MAKTITLKIEIDDGQAIKSIDSLADGLSDLDRRAAREIKESLSSMFFSSALGANVASNAISFVADTIRQLGGEAARAAVEVESVVAKISTIANVNNSQVSQSLFELSTKVPQSAAQLGEGLYNIFSSVEASQSQALALLEQYSKGATAAATDTESFGTAITGVLNAYKLDLSDAGHISDIFFNTVNKGVVSGQELAANLGLVTQSAKGAGVNFETLGGLIAGVTKEGGSASQNINNLNNLLLKMPEAAEKLKNSLQISTTDANGNFRPILDVLAELKQKLETMTPEAATNKIRELFPDLQAQTGLRTILSQLDFIKQASLDNANAFGVTEAAYRKMSQTAAAQMQILYNSAIAFLAALSEWVTKSQIVGGAMSALSSILQTMSRNTGTVLALVAALGLLVAAYNAVAIAAGISGAAQALGAFASSAGGTVFVIQNVVRAMTGLQTAFITTAETAIAATGGWAAVIAIIGLVIYAIIQYNDTQRKTAEEHQKGIDGVKGQMDALAKQREQILNATANTSELIAKQKDLSGVYATLNEDSKTRADKLAQETGAAAGLRAEIERLQKSKRLELEAKLVEVTNDAIRAYEAKEIAARKAEAADAAYQDALRRNVDDMPTFSDKSGLRTNKKIISEYRQEMLDTSAASDVATAKFDGLRSVILGGVVPLNQSARAFVEQKEKMREVHNATDGFRQSLIGFNGELANTKNAANNTADATDNLAASIANLKKQATARSGMLSDAILEASAYAKSGAEAVKNYQQLLTDRPDLKQAYEDEKRINENRAAIEKQYATSAASRAKASRDSASAENQLKRETNELAKATRELNALRAGGGDLYNVKVRREAIENEKRLLENILKLRQELNQPTRAPLPQDFQTAKIEVEQLERVKRLRDEVLKTQRESADADDKLLVARLTADTEIVSAQTRADSAYFDGIKKRRDAEAQLTADIAGEIRRREFAQTESAKNAITAQAEAYKEFLGERTNKEFEYQKRLAKLALDIGATFADNPLINAADKLSQNKPDASPVVTELKTSNDTLKQILQALQPLRGGDGASYQPFDYSASAPPTKRAAEVLRSVLAPSKFDAQIEQAAAVVSKQKGVAADVIETLIKATLYRESGGRAGLVSEAGARGYFQMIPETARRLKVKNPNDFLQAAIGAGNELVDGLLRGGVEEAFAGYFAGAGGGNRGRKTRDYTRAQTYVFNEAQRLRNNLPTANGATVTLDPMTGEFISNQKSPPPSPSSAAQTRPRIAGVNPIADDFNQTRQQFFGDLTNEQMSGESLNNLIEYYALLEKFTRRSGEAQSIGEREAVGAAKMARYRNVQIEQIREISVLEERLNALRNGDDATRAEVLQQKDIEDKRKIGNLLAENIVLTDNLRTGNRDAEMEAAQFANERLKILNSVGDAEANLERARALNADADVRRARQAALVLNERAQIENRLAEIENQRQTLGANQGLRVRLAAEEELLAFQKQQLEAQEKIARAQVRISDQTRFSVDDIRAEVLGFLAQQKTLSQTIAEEIKGIYEQAASFIDKSLDKFGVGKIPILGGVLKFQARQQLTSLTKSALDLFFPNSGLSEMFDQSQQNPISQPIVAEQKETNKILRQIAGIGAAIKIPGFGGRGGFSLPIPFLNNSGAAFGGGGFSTPPFNPNAQGSANSFNPSDLYGSAGAGWFAQSGGAGGGGFWSQIKGLFGKSGSFWGDKGFGNNVGTYGAIGSIGSLLGGLIGGTAGSYISSVASGVATGASIGSMIPGVGTAIGAVVGGAIGFFARLFGGDPRKKEDKNQNMPALQKGFTDALQQLRDLAANKNSILSDPAGSVAKALEIRNQIASGFGIQFKSGKYQKESQKLIQQKLVEADAIIAQIKEFAKKAQGAKDLEGRIIGEFASGTYLSSAFLRRNGRLYGGISGKDSLPSLLMPGEMVLNQSQQARIRAAAGHDVFAGAGIPNYDQPRARFAPVRMETGGLYAGGASSPSPQASQIELSPQIVVNITLNEREDGTWEQETNSDKGQKIIANIVAYKYKKGELKLERQ